MRNTDRFYHLKPHRIWELALNNYFIPVWQMNYFTERKGPCSLHLIEIHQINQR